ncbi:MAG: carbohydrate porin [Candidatus Binatus sp.]|jgi:porin
MSRSILRSLVASLVLAGVLAAIPAHAQTFSTPWMHATQGDWATEWGILDPQLLFLPGSWAQLTAATGNWDGIRTDLSDAGISAFGSYQSESAGNPVGGEVHKFRYTHNIALGIALDLHKLIGLEDTYFLASASERTGNSLSYDIPNFFQVQQIFGHQTIRLVDLAVEHLFLDKKLDVVAGRINALDDFATSPYYCFAQNLGFCGNPLSIPVNASVPSYPGAAWGIRARYEITPEFYSMTGAYNTYADFRSDKFHGVDFSLRHNSGVAIMEELGYSPKQLRDLGFPGTYKLGGLYDSEPRLQFETGQMRGGTWQMYLTGQQRLLRRPEGAVSAHQGLWSFLAFTYAPPKMNQLEYFGDGGLLYFGLIPHRPEDELGLFGLWGQFSSDLRDAQRADHEPTQTHEAIIEANYMYNVTPSLTVQPDIQGVFRPEGTGLISDTLVLAVQVTVAL